eukprot:TRINITY_DN450_c0_g1_i1.p1 TRINITY_DN450_c0_g1~~TRINITY_DN450_c0_g1_i1.p1  ORF type:complete len:102 (-),score=39.26 TRINITY_DN450_c0_g1_i1:85-357(-)
MSKHIQLYTSSATSSLKIKKDQTALKSLLEAKRVKYEEYDIASDQARKEEMQQRSGKTTIPQLFIDGKFVGGYDEASELEEDGQFAALVQ